MSPGNMNVYNINNNNNVFNEQQEEEEAARQADGADVLI